MQAWLYQMRNQDRWRPENYRLEVWERVTVTWPAGRITSRSEISPEPGDVLLFFYAKR